MAHDGLAQTFSALGTLAQQEERKGDARHYFAQSEREFLQAIYWAEAQDKPQAIFYANLGWFYLERQRHSEAIEAFELAMSEDFEFFGNYWGIGRAMLEMENFEDARYYLGIALDNAPEDLQPPTSMEIPELLQRCERLISEN